MVNRWLLCAALAACACPSKPGATPPGPGSGSATPPTTAGAAPGPTCDGVRPKVEQLYRAEAQAKEPKRVEDAVADNTQMVMADCVKDPAKVVACVDKAQSVDELETQCLAPLDEEGTEGARK